MIAFGAGREIVGWDFTVRAAEAVAVTQAAVFEQANAGTLPLETDDESALAGRATRLVLSASESAIRSGGNCDSESQTFIESWRRYLTAADWYHKFAIFAQAGPVLNASTEHCYPGGTVA